jgi:HSP20 family protein
MPVPQAVFEPLLPLPQVTADGAWSPHIDIRELPDEYIVLADLPGVEPEAVHVTTDTDTLTITGARRDRLRAGGVPYLLERPTGKLRRSVPLPGPYDPTKIQTQIRDGVLEINVPRERKPSAPRIHSQKPAGTDTSSRADAAGAERSCVGADLFECVGERFDVGVGEMFGEVSLDSVSVVAAGAL